MRPFEPHFRIILYLRSTQLTNNISIEPNNAGGYIEADIRQANG
jgi:hypothetical protein